MVVGGEGGGMEMEEVGKETEVLLVIGHATASLNKVEPGIFAIILSSAIIADLTFPCL